MKIMQTVNTVLNTREFNKLSEKISDSLYALNPDIQDLYDIHINYIDDSWDVAFVPLINSIPIIKVNTYTEFTNKGAEILKLTPTKIDKFPDTLKLRDESKSYDLCINYVAIFEFVISLYEYEYKLN